MNMNTEHTTCGPLNAMSRISWGAIFGGAFIAMFFQLLLGLLGLAIGLTVLDPGQAIPARGLTIGAGIWMVLTTIISVFIGAFAAGRFAGLSAKYDGLLHGVATLAFLSILSIFLVSSGVSNVVGGAFSFGLQAAKLPQAQQAMPGQTMQQTGAAAQLQNMTPQQRMMIQQQANKYATTATWITFITSLLALIVAAIGGFLGMQSRVRQVIREST